MSVRRIYSTAMGLLLQGLIHILPIFNWRSLDAWKAQQYLLTHKNKMGRNFKLKVFLHRYWLCQKKLLPCPKLYRLQTIWKRAFIASAPTLEPQFSLHLISFFPFYFCQIHKQKSHGCSDADWRYFVQLKYTRNYPNIQNSKKLFNQLRCQSVTIRITQNTHCAYIFEKPYLCQLITQNAYVRRR